MINSVDGIRKHLNEVETAINYVFNPSVDPTENLSDLIWKAKEALEKLAEATSL